MGILPGSHPHREGYEISGFASSERQGLLLKKIS
jgi:hypothetical protein